MKVIGMITALWVLLAPALAAEMVVKVDGIRNGKGFVRGLVYKGALGFPEDYTKAVSLAETRAKTGEVTLRFKGVAEGLGAIIIIHDENDDKKLRKNLIGIPREGVGASNWSMKKGRPRFKDAVVPVGPGKVVRVRIKYF